MNQTNRTTLEHINAPIPKEPCHFTQAAKATISYSNEEGWVAMRVYGDRFKGAIRVKYNHGTDLYDVEFFKVVKLHVKTVNKREGVYFDELAQYLWNETFIV